MVVTLAAYILPIEKWMTTVLGDEFSAVVAISSASSIAPALCKILAKLRRGMCCNKNQEIYKLFH